MRIQTVTPNDEPHTPRPRSSPASRKAPVPRPGWALNAPNRPKPGGEICTLADHGEVPVGNDGAMNGDRTVPHGGSGHHSTGSRR